MKTARLSRSHARLLAAAWKWPKTTCLKLDKSARFFPAERSCRRTQANQSQALEGGCTKCGQRRRSPTFIVLSVLALGLAATAEVSLMGSVISTAHAQPAETSRLQLRAQMKSAAEKLNDTARGAPDKIRAMFAGNTPSATLLALNEKSIAAQAEFENAVLTAQKSGALSDDESKQLARLGELAKKTRDPVKGDIATLKSLPSLPFMGRDAAVRLAPKSQQDAAINHAEAAKRAVGELVKAIRTFP